MTFHILNGDALAEEFPNSIDANPIIIKEAFIDGPVTTDYGDAGYWLKRAQYIVETYDADARNYLYQFVTEQLGRMQQIKNGDHVYLWFEDDLFCQANMWFVIHYVTRFAQPQFYRVFPKQDTIAWSGFGNANSEESLLAFQESSACNTHEIELVNLLWETYVHQDTSNMKLISKVPSKCIRFLPEIIQAHLDRIPNSRNPGKPKMLLTEIMKEGKKDFPEIFATFSIRAGIYGYSDVQVKNMLEEMEITNLS